MSSLLNGATPMCCGIKSRHIINGMNERLNYWYCDTCKDVAKEGTRPSYEHLDIQLAWLLQQPLYLPPLALPVPANPPAVVAPTVAQANPQPQPQGPLVPPPAPYIPPCIIGHRLSTGTKTKVRVPFGIPCNDIVGHCGPWRSATVNTLCNCGEVTY